MSETWPNESSGMRRRTIAGRFYRIVFATDVDRILAGATNKEGRFHRDGQPALYLSPELDWARRAIEPYEADADARRVAIPLSVGPASVVDLRSGAHCAALNIDPADALTPWLSQRSRGNPADSWRPAEAARASGADGMIYPARSSVVRWHLVLFRWNTPEAAAVAVADLPIALPMRRATARSMASSSRDAWSDEAAR